MSKLATKLTSNVVNNAVIQIQGIHLGIDEAGRGPLVGDVYAAAVILDPSLPIHGLADSKTLSDRKREQLSHEILENALAFGVASASHLEIDELNILQATLLAMRRACEICLKMARDKSLPMLQVHALVDGNRDPRLGIPTQCIVKGDSKVTAISAASILAKTARDHSMALLHTRFPEYGFDRHKGYGTAVHMTSLKRYGALPEHRQSFAPVALAPLRGVSL
jgi:ribonuclease HII